MSHQDKDRCRVRYNAEYLQQALQWLLGRVAWSGIQFRQDCTWLPAQLARAALIWAWSDELTLGERFFTARKITAQLDQPQQEFAGSSQAFWKMLVRWTARLVTLIQACFRQSVQDTLAANWSLHGWIVFGVDGSRIELPRTRSHEAAYSPSAKRRSKKKKHRRRKTADDAAAAKKARTPLIWLTILWHAGTGLPWAWRIGATDSSEREHWMQMLPELPAQSLVAADAGYVGYEYVQAVIASGRQLLLRVGSNVRLLRKLGWAKESAGTVYLWPERAARQNLPPLVLRLVISHNGKHPVYLVTSVLSGTRLSDRQVIDLYRQRWGIELFFRHLKQTFQRRKLRSTSADHARVELEWSLLGLWGLALYAQAVLRQEGLAPERLSTACVLRAFRRMLRDYLHPVERGRSLRALLRRALRDEYPRQYKASRDYPCQKRRKPIGPPEILPASRARTTLARRLRATVQKGLTA